MRPTGLHVAIIMDGNGRWAVRRGLPRPAGHHAGAKAVRRVVEAAPDLGISTLTLFAFSSDNWHRPSDEVTALMDLFRTYLNTETERCVEQGVRISVIGRRDRLEPQLLAAVQAAETATTGRHVLHLRIAVDYSGRDAILTAAEQLSNVSQVSREIFSHLLGSAVHAEGPAPDVDLLIRTGGERRLSDFLLWECAYAELLFTDRMWPDFHAVDLKAAVREFHARLRRFGRIVEAAVPQSRSAGENE